ncbi:hypothetical protein HID58_002715 [Brassica napus]|uniref:Uncharacterized protein n=1 Tax=Brassica napus TaxID=3708 RepID=A0ABQ8EN21_BRANA|nr:hypothetical protein HID58_002715 [Brassica napus]
MYSFRSYISRSSAVRYLYSLRLSSHLISSISLHFRFVTSSRKWLRQVLPLLTPPPVTPPSLTSPARGPYSTFDTLRLGRSAQTIVARLIRLWDSRNIHKNGEFMGITILLLDEQCLLTLILSFQMLLVKYVPFRGLISKTTQLLPEWWSAYLSNRETVTVNVSLWDEAASAFRGRLRDGDKSQSVMLLTSVNPKLFGGNLYLNSTQGTRFYFDTTLPEIAEFVSRVGATSAQVYSCVDTLEGIKKKELVSIKDLNSFISNSNEQTQEADFLCKARIVCVIPENGCVSSDVTGVVRFRVELAVDDGNDSATFVSDGGEEYLPSCLEELEGKEFVFQIRVTPFNFTPNYRTFTVSTITDEDSTIATQLKAHSEGIIPSGSGDVGLSASSSGPSVLEVKHGEKCSSAAPPENADTLKKRKRSRE